MDEVAGDLLRVQFLQGIREVKQNLDFAFLGFIEGILGECDRLFVAEAQESEAIKSVLILLQAVAGHHFSSILHQLLQQMFLRVDFALITLAMNQLTGVFIKCEINSLEKLTVSIQFEGTFLSSQWGGESDTQAMLFTEFSRVKFTDLKAIFNGQR